MDTAQLVAMDRGLDLSRQNIASLAQIPSDLVDQVECDGETYELSLAQNRLTTLADIQVFRTVRQLDLSSNNLQTLDGIQALLELESLVVARNKLTSIEAVASLQQLRVLNVSENQLHQVDVLKSIPQIAQVDASYNNLTKWPQLSSCSRLQSIDLSSNLLEAFPPSAASRLFPRALRRLVVTKNQIHELCGIACLGQSLSMLQTLELDGNPGMQRVTRDGGTVDFMLVNLFPSVLLASERDKRPGGRGGSTRQDLTVPGEVVRLVEDAVWRGDEDILARFLITGTAEASGTRYNDLPTKPAPPSTDTHRFKVNDLSKAAPSSSTTEESLIEQRATQGTGLSKESKMEMWKRMMEERKGSGQREQSRSESTCAPETNGRASHSTKPSTPPLPLPVQKLVKPSSQPPAPAAAAVRVPLSPATSIPAAPKADTVAAKAIPPAQSGDNTANQLRMLTEQVASMRKYMKVWIKREQMTRDSAAKRLQRWIRWRQGHINLRQRIRSSRRRRVCEYALLPCSSNLIPVISRQMRTTQLRVHLSAQVIQRHIRGWLSRQRVSRWMWHTGAAQRIQRVWKQRRRQRALFYDLNGIKPPKSTQKRQSSRNSEALVDKLVGVVAGFSADLKTLERTQVVQEQMIAQLWEESARYRRFFEFKLTKAVIKLQSMWRGFRARQSVALGPRTLSMSRQSQTQDEVASLRADLERLTGLVMTLMEQNKSTEGDHTS